MQALNPKAVARNVLPVPTAPTAILFSQRSMNLGSTRSVLLVVSGRVTGDQSKFSSDFVLTNPAVLIFKASRDFNIYSSVKNPIKKMPRCPADDTRLANYSIDDQQKVISIPLNICYN